MVKNSKILAFTLAEVLITLGIIGVVAALTLPSVIQSHQKQVTVNRLKKVYSVLSQVVIRSYAENGSPLENLTGEAITADKTQEIFETYWLPYFKSPTVAEDGKSLYSKPYQLLNGDTGGTPVTSYKYGRILFSTADGFIIYTSILAWNKDENGEYAGVYNSSAQVIVDINGSKGPNTYGKDVFEFYADFDKNKVLPLGSNYTTAQINHYCSKNSIGDSCATKIIKDGWKIADDYPW